MQYLNIVMLEFSEAFWGIDGVPRRPGRGERSEVGQSRVVNITGLRPAVLEASLSGKG